MCPTQFLSIYMISGKIILDMFSARTRYIAARAAIRYKKDGNLTKSVFFDANNLRLFACLFDSNCNSNGHTNHGVVTCADNRRRASLQATLVSEPRKIAPRALGVAQQGASHQTSSEALMFASREYEPIKRGQAKPDLLKIAYFEASSIATATATVIPTMGLLPAPIRPIISTCAGTEDEPANCASPCIRPRVSVIP